MVVDDLPGAEVVSEGVDPRAAILLDDLSLSDGTTLRRCFVYQRNLERLMTGPEQVEEVLGHLLAQEIPAAFEK